MPPPNAMAATKDKDPLAQGIQGEVQKALPIYPYSTVPAGL